MSLKRVLDYKSHWIRSGRIYTKLLLVIVSVQEESVGYFFLLCIFLNIKNIKYKEHVSLSKWEIIKVIYEF